MSKIKGDEKMGRRIYIILVTIFVFFSDTEFVPNIVFGEGIEYERCVIYTLSRNEFLDIIESPSVEKIINAERQERHIIEQSGKDGRGLRYKSIGVRREGNDYIGTYSVGAAEKRYLNGSVILSYHFFEMCNDVNIIEDSMTSAGIRCNVLSVVPFYMYEYDVVTTFGVPVTLYIETDIGNYFMTINEKSEIPENVITTMSQEYDLAIYTSERYKERFGIHEGKININGVLYEDENFKVQFDNCFIPLRFVMEALGCTVAWDDQTRGVSIVNNQKEFAFKVDDFVYPYACEMQNNRTIIYMYELKEILKVLDMNMNISLDIDNRILNITSHNN